MYYGTIVAAMGRGPLFKAGYRPQFSGHETFPLRYGWLKKAFDHVGNAKKDTDCWGEYAISELGVGRKMVASIHHWAVAAAVVEDNRKATTTTSHTDLGRLLFGPSGVDPYMEHPTTLWLLHWKLATCVDKKTTWFWAFSHFPFITFDRDDFVLKLAHLAKERNWKRSAGATIRNDVACFIRTYVSKDTSGKVSHDDVLESPLTELGLIKSVGKKDKFRFVRGPKPSLGEGVFAYALTDFWSRERSNAETLSFEAIAHEPGSPGRVFQMDENSVAERLFELDRVTRGVLTWSETAGLGQVMRSKDTKDKYDYIRQDYHRPRG